MMAAVKLARDNRTMSEMLVRFNDEFAVAVTEVKITLS